MALVHEYTTPLGPEDFAAALAAARNPSEHPRMEMETTALGPHAWRLAQVPGPDLLAKNGPPLSRVVVHLDYSPAPGGARARVRMAVSQLYSRQCWRLFGGLGMCVLALVAVFVVWRAPSALVTAGVFGIAWAGYFLFMKREPSQWRAMLASDLKLTPVVEDPLDEAPKQTEIAGAADKSS